MLMKRARSAASLDGGLKLLAAKGLYLDVGYPTLMKVRPMN